MSKNICYFEQDIKFEQEIKFEQLKLDKVKQEKVQQIASIICALLNTSGGQLDIFIDNIANGKATVHNFIRAIEQRFQNTIGGLDTNEKIVQQPVTPEKITFVVKALESSLCTLNYNLFLPGTPQVQIIEPNEPITAIERLIEGKPKATHREKIQLGSHRRMFTRGEQCEDKLKSNCNVICKPIKVGRNVKKEIINKQSNFQKQVSALANDAGGHIYHGIKSGKVEGVFVEENKIESIISAIEEALKNLIWGGDENPKRHREWDVYFEHVKDENGDIIKQTVVIVVSIASYNGGVFTAEPDCYQVVQRNVEKMDFSTWKNELLRRRTLRQCKSVDELVHSIKASSDFTSLG